MDKYPFDGATADKRAYLLAHPALAAYWKDKFGDAWWEKEAKVYSPRSWSGGGGGGGWSASPPDVRQRYMDPGLWQLSDRDLPEYRAPIDNTSRWLNAGDRLLPGVLREWTPRR